MPRNMEIFIHKVITYNRLNNLGKTKKDHIYAVEQHAKHIPKNKQPKPKIEFGYYNNWNVHYTTLMVPKGKTLDILSQHRLHLNTRVGKGGYVPFSPYLVKS